MEIKIAYSDDAMWGEAGDDGHDVESSYAKFELMVSEAIQAHEPSAIIKFDNGINDYVEVDDQRDSDNAEWASQVMGKVWESFDWAVEKAA